MIANRKLSVTENHKARERALGSGLSLFETATARLPSLDKKVLEKLGDISAELLPHTSGQVSKSMTVMARLFWALSGNREKVIVEAKLADVEREIESLKIRLALTVGVQ